MPPDRNGTIRHQSRLGFRALCSSSTARHNRGRKPGWPRWSAGRGSRPSNDGGSHTAHREDLDMFDAASYLPHSDHFSSAWTSSGWRPLVSASSRVVRTVGARTAGLANHDDGGRGSSLHQPAHRRAVPTVGGSVRCCRTCRGRGDLGLPADDRGLPRIRRSLGRELMRTLIDSVNYGIPAALTKLRPLVRTLEQRAVDVLACFDRPGKSNGPTEAVAIWSSCGAPPSGSATSPTTSADPPGDRRL